MFIKIQIICRKVCVWWGGTSLKTLGGWIFRLVFHPSHSLDNVTQGHFSGKKSDALHIGGTAVPVLQVPLKDALLFQCVSY